MLDVKFSNKAMKFLSNCNDNLYNRLIDKIKNLQKNPFPSDIKRILGKKDKVFRVRMGSYRILYLIIKDKNLLFISNIDERSQIYKK